MSTLLSGGKMAEIKGRIQLNPEILIEDPNYLDEIIQRAADWLVTECRLPRYPELAKGFAESVASAGTDITAITTSEMIVTVNQGLSGTVQVVQTSNNTGALIATAIQTAIQAEATEGWDEVICTFTASTGKYKILSGRYGPSSEILIDFTEDQKHLCQTLGLTPLFGGVFEVGALDRLDADSIVAAQATIFFRKIGVEGVESGSIPGESSFVFSDLDPQIRQSLGGLRQLWARGWR